MLYLDTSALAKLYLAEPDSRDVEKLVERHEPWLFTSVLTMTESGYALHSRLPHILWLAGPPAA